MEKFTSFLITISFLFLCSLSYSATLADVYELALTNDPQLKIDEATYNADKEIKNKALAGLLPKLSLRAGTTWNENKNTEVNASLFTDTEGSNSNFYSANLIQPIFRVDTWFQFSQGKALGQAAEAKFALSQQETIIRISNVYFDLLKALKNLEVARLEEQSIKKQRDRTKRLYEEGVSSKSEFQEAQAFYDLARVSKIASEGQLEFAKEAMISIVGDAPEIKDLNDNFPVSKPDPIEQDQWAELALTNSFLLKASKLNATAAKKNSQAKIASHFPDIDLVASFTQNNSRGIVDFDPITKGHIDLVERACKLFDKVVLAIAASEAKSPLFTLEERINISKRIFKGNDQVEIIGFSGLLVDLAKDNDANILIRGLRVVADFEYEFQLANMNRAMMPELESVFLTPVTEYSFVSSSLVKEICKMGGDVSSFVDPISLEEMKKKFD